MPLYDYICRACDATWEDFYLIKDRLKPTKRPCPNCEKKKTVELAPAAPAFADSHRIGVSKLPTSWTDRLKEIKKNNYGSTIKTDRSGR